MNGKKGKIIPEVEIPIDKKKTKQFLKEMYGLNIKRFDAVDCFNCYPSCKVLIKFYLDKMSKKEVYELGKLVSKGEFISPAQTTSSTLL